jgi:VIT1/CCC1 family predicted Fe2+/Mn2+ transporter
VPHDIHDEHHRQVSDGWFRAAIFGVSDGLVTNTSFILGFAGASPGHSVVRVAGLAALIAGGFSMGSGELLSMQAQRELLEYEIDVERRAIAENPELERQELSALFQARGIELELAERLSVDLMRDPDLALRTHAREELGVDPSAVGSPWSAAVSSFISFSVGAFLPLVPWLVTSKGDPVGWSIALAAVGAAVVGGSIGWFSRRGIVRWAVRQLVVTGLASAVTFGVGHLIGNH